MNVVFTPLAKEDLADLPDDDQRTVVREIQQISDNPKRHAERKPSCLVFTVDSTNPPYSVVFDCKQQDMEVYQIRESSFVEGP